MIDVLIVDDERPARRRVRRLLEPQTDIRVVGECANGREAVAAIAEHRPDLVFLDVQMPGMDGFEVLDEIVGTHLPAVVFVTAHDQYAVDAFTAHAVDYLLKPFDEERFLLALERARANLADGTGRLYARLAGLIADLRTSEADHYLERVAVKRDGRTTLVGIGEVDWIESEGNYIRLHAGSSSHRLRTTLAAFEERLDPSRFARIHRSIIVNLDRVKEIAPWFHGDYAVFLRDGTRLSLSRSFRARLERILGA